MIEINRRKARSLSLLGTSGALGTAAVTLGETNPNVFMITADLCFFSGLDRFKNDYPDRLINVGIAEQNMVGVAAGLAKEGFIPYVGTYASFVSRCFDQIRVNMSYMQLPIKFIGLSSGYATGILGATHTCIEDMALMRAMPNIDVISPADGVEIVKAMLAVADTDRPAYVRLSGTVPTPIVYTDDYNFEIGHVVKLKEGGDICLIATGSMVYYSLQVAELLEEKGISVTVVDMHTIKPLDKEAVNSANDNHKMIVTLEEHSIYGGLYGTITEYLCSAKNHIPIRAIGINDFFVKPGSYQYQISESGLSVDNILNRITRWYEEIK